MTRTSLKGIPIREGLFEMFDDGPRLVGSRCRECLEVVFPADSFCPRCCLETADTIPLSTRGTLYSFTIQRFRPPPPYRGPEPFVPYGVGMVELPEGIRLTTVLEESEPENLAVGQQVELVVTPFFLDDDGNEILGYKFRPVAAGEAS